ncbi:conserved hypothetical protein [metagenome]|uniref:FHA domain-containing protein n=1 Tax=metagenome TaxID=256318 RepID=A0A2P2C8F2_9ZZZZ
MPLGEPTPAAEQVLTLDFAGELHRAAPGEQLRVGRAGDVAIDDNPFLHRDFLVLDWANDLWWIHNVGSRLAAYLTDERSLMRSTLSPGGKVPLIFPRTLVTFAAGETTYELELAVPSVGYDATPGQEPGGTGQLTIAPGKFTESQLLAVLALAEPVLKREGTGSGEIPSTQAAARRLGWTPKRFDKKLENVCDKLAAAGVRGLRADRNGVAANRRRHLVEYAVSSRLVTPDDLPRLDAPQTAVDG